MTKLIVLLGLIWLVLIVPSPVAKAAGPSYNAPQYTTPPKIVFTPAPGPVKELPQTGGPLAGFLIFALAPLGWKLRRYKISNLAPNDIWQGRELKR